MSHGSSGPTGVTNSTRSSAHACWDCANVRSRSRRASEPGPGTAATRTGHSNSFPVPRSGSATNDAVSAPRGPSHSPICQCEARSKFAARTSKEGAPRGSQPGNGATAAAQASARTVGSRPSCRISCTSPFASTTGLIVQAMRRRPSGRAAIASVSSAAMSMGFAQRRYAVASRAFEAARRVPAAESARPNCASSSCAPHARRPAVSSRRVVTAQGPREICHRRVCPFLHDRPSARSCLRPAVWLGLVLPASRSAPDD